MELLTIIFIIFVTFQSIYILWPLYAVRPKCGSPFAKNEIGISIIIPAYNEERVIINCLKSLLNVQYTNYEIFIIDDGSRDATIQELNKYLQLVPIRKKAINLSMNVPVISVYKAKKNKKVLVISKLNGGKAEALNTGIALASKEVIITLDADSMLETNALKVINKVFKNKNIVAAGGIVHVVQGANTCACSIFKTSYLALFQTLEYLVAFYTRRTTQSHMDAMLVISGAFGIFRTNLLTTIGGYEYCIGEDMDITIRIHKYLRSIRDKRKMIFIPEAICYTECPETLMDHYKQRIRWQKSFVYCLCRYGKDIIINLGFKFSIFMILDYLLTNITALIAAVCISIMLLETYEDYTIAIISFVIVFFLNILMNIVGLIISRRFRTRIFKSGYVTLMFVLLLDFIYKTWMIIHTTAGILLYFTGKNSWNKVERIGKNFGLFPSEVQSVN